MALENETVYARLYATGVIVSTKRCVVLYGLHTRVEVVLSKKLEVGGCQTWGIGANPKLAKAKDQIDASRDTWDASTFLN